MYKIYPYQFQYVPCNIPSDGTPRELFEDCFEGCQCSYDSCQNSDGDILCTCLTHGLWYSFDGRLLPEVLTPESRAVVQECHNACKCSTTCINRVVQHGIRVQLELFVDATKGLSVRTLEPLKRGQFVCEYAGEILTESEARNVAEILSPADMNFLFTLRENLSQGVHCTYYYPRHKGNIGRFINHSCEPNLSVVPVRIRNSIPHLCLFASRDISEATEVTYDYGHGSAVSDSENSGTVCRCGTAMCKGFLPGYNVF